MNFGRADYNERIIDKAGLIPEDEPVFLLRASDAAAPEAIKAWARRAEVLKAEPAIVAAAYEQSHQVTLWQRTHGAQTPDLPPEQVAALAADEEEGLETSRRARAITEAAAPPSAEPERVSHPAHYGGADNLYETIKVMEARLTAAEFIGAMKFQVYKYNDRHRAKGGFEDLRKAKFYQDYLVAYIERHGLQHLGVVFEG